MSAARNPRAASAVQLDMKRGIGVPGLLVAVALVSAGCASTSHAPAAQTTPAGQHRAASPSASASASPSCGPGTSAGEAASPGRQPTLNAVQFVSASGGWVVGSDRILHTADSGRDWRTQFVTSAAAQLRTIDFTDTRHGWVTGASELLATTDGGAHWRTLPEPCQTIRAVHFVNSLDGFAVAGGTVPDPSQPPFSVVPQARGTLLRSTDGGLHWRRLSAPADVQTACFSNLASGWVGAGGNIYGTVNGGQNWTLAVRSRSSQGLHGTAVVQCAGSGSAWAYVSGPGAGLGHVPQIGYHTFGRTWRPIFAEQYFPHPGVRVRAEAPSVYPGPFSAISESQAAFIGSCPACTAPASPRLLGPAPLVLALGGGAHLIRRGRIANLSQATGAAFLSASDGWVVGINQGRSVTSFIMHTADGGMSWQAQYRLAP
ncbi:MAG: WD40/YVTN/BNR-like repeat-containing protein [Streptosporangiaceae bacterium]